VQGNSENLRDLKKTSAKHVLLVLTGDQGLDNVGYCDRQFALATPALDTLAMKVLS